MLPTLLNAQETVCQVISPLSTVNIAGLKIAALAPAYSLYKFANVISLSFIFQDVFLCMLRNLFEEYRFFPQYPEKELHITACLFGGIIEQGLVT